LRPHSSNVGQLTCRDPGLHFLTSYLVSNQACKLHQYGTVQCTMACTLADR
jgi:hypothetical protein